MDYTINNGLVTDSLYKYRTKQVNFILSYTDMKVFLQNIIIQSIHVIQPLQIHLELKNKKLEGMRLFVVLKKI